MLDVLEVAEERLRAELAHLLAGRAADGRVGGDETDALSVAVLCREALEERVGVGREAHGERAELGVGATPVEDDDPASPAHGDEVGEPVGQLARVGERARVQEVEAVEEVQRRISQLAASVPRRAAPPWRR